ncbi:MAG TPA: MFS transporter [Tepidisphaeraceae bacterium]|nr:MFS transporter [Tepidisphaeraceae bacterium]
MVLRRNLIILLAVACGVAVANLYYNQPLLENIGRSFGTDPAGTGLIATFSQAGYAAGMLAFVPLIDLIERRRLIVTLQVLVTVALLAVAMAPTFNTLLAASFAVGCLTVAPQLIIPYTASVAEPKQQGRMIGSLYTGLLLGILLARTVSGFVGQQWGWRTMYFAAAAAAALLALLLRLALPKSSPGHDHSYAQLMASLATMVRSYPALRESAIIGGALFGSFSAFWTTLAFRLAQPPYHFGPRGAGLFGIIGAVGAIGAPIAGRLADRHGPRLVIGFAIAVTLAAFAVFLGFDLHIAGLIAGVIVLDLGVQAAQVCNQSRIFALAPGAQGRANTVYMIVYFTGGALGSFLAATAWQHWHWPGVCGVGLGLVLFAAAAHARGSLPTIAPEPANAAAQ